MIENVEQTIKDDLNLENKQINNNMSMDKDGSEKSNIMEEEKIKDNSDKKSLNKYTVDNSDNETKTANFNQNNTYHFSDNEKIPFEGTENNENSLSKFQLNKNESLNEEQGFTETNSSPQQIKKPIEKINFSPLVENSNQSNISPKNINTNYNNTLENYNSIYEEPIILTNNKSSIEITDKSFDKHFINSIPTKVLNQTVPNNNLQKMKIEDFSINKNLNFQFFNENEKPHYLYNTLNSVEKDFLNKTQTQNPNTYYLNPFTTIPYDYTIMNPFINYIRPTIAYPYFQNQQMIPNQTIIPPPQQNPYQNNISQMNVGINNPQMNGNLDLQNKNFQQKVSIIKLESENKALKEKIIELSNNVSNLQQNLNTMHIQTVKFKEPEVNNKEHDIMIRDLKNKVNMFNSKIENRDNDLKEKEQHNREIEQTYQEKFTKFSKDIDNLYKEIQKKEDLLKKVLEENENYRRYIDTIKRENTNLKNSKTKLENESSILMGKLEGLEKEKIAIEKKLLIDENQIKNLKTDFDNLMKQTQVNKKQNNSLEDKISELNAENYNLKQENQDLRKTVTNQNNKLESLNQELSSLRIEKQHNQKKKGQNNNNNNKNYNEEIIEPMYSIPKDKNINEINYRRGKQKSSDNHNNLNDKYINEEDEENSFYEEEKINNRNKYKKKNKRSPTRSKDSKAVETSNHNRKEINLIDQKLNDLLTEKSKIESDLFKLPEKQRSLLIINKRKLLENQIENINKEISVLRIKLREIAEK